MPNKEKDLTKGYQRSFILFSSGILILSMLIGCDRSTGGLEAVDYTPLPGDVAYNVFFWIPILLPFTKVIDYRTGFILLFVVTVIRAAANLYRNNVLNAEQAAYFPLRSP